MEAALNSSSYRSRLYH